MPRIGVGLGLGLRQAVAAAGGYDADAQAFFDRVTTAGGTLTTTEKNATNQLVLDMKSAGIWTSMKAVYPMVGASAAACAQNLVSASFTGTFSSGWTFASTGVTPNGTSAYFDSNFNFTGNLSITSLAFGGYTSTSTQKDGGYNGSINPNFVHSWYGYNLAESFIFSSISVSGGVLGFMQNNLQGGFHKLFKNNTIANNTPKVITSIPNQNMFVGACNNGGLGALFDNHLISFYYYADGLTDTQASNFYTAVQTFNTTLNRSVGTPIVSDADAQAYINRVYTAGGTLTNTEANAVNQLVIDMKAAGIWTAMKAVYPMVGSSAAACAQNLKSSSYTGTFTSGWTFASTGVQGNGTSAYMSTGLNPSTALTNNNLHIAYYSRTNVNEARQDFNASNGVPATSEIFTTMYLNTLYFTSNIFAPNTVSQSVANTLGFVIGNTTANNIRNIWKGGIKLATDTSVNTTALPNITANLGARANPIQEYSTKEFAFASIGDGLNDTQAANFYTCVQTFNTSLSRQV